MKALFLAMAALLLLSTPAAAQDDWGAEARPFRVSSLGTPFAVQGEFEGEYRLYPNWIEVVVTKANVRVSEHCPYQGRRLLSSLKFRLATAYGERGWRLVGTGPAFALDRVVRPGDMFGMGELYFHIPVDDDLDLSRHWLVAEVEDTALDIPGGDRERGYAFAHSPRDMFTQAVARK